jgi:hypothetical protein
MYVPGPTPFNSNLHATAGDARERTASYIRARHLHEGPRMKKAPRRPDPDNRLGVR